MFGRKRTEDHNDTAVPVIELDYLVHTDDRPFCEDMTCYCHKKRSNVRQNYVDYREGLLSKDEKKRIYRGRYV